MDPVLTEWVSMIIRWLHVVAGIAWIGSSFYFVHLDLSLKPNEALPKGAHGEAWQVHGGGFYHMAKYMVAPARMPAELTWFKWEAYTTWLSGFALLVVVYYLGADLYLVDRAVSDLDPAMAVAISLLALVFAWIGYEALCRSPLGERETLLALALYAALVAMTFALTHLFSGRGAFVQVGALIGTMMVANVFVVIIPNQKRVVAALLAGEMPDPALGKQAKQRSVHNNYLTLPVVFVMIANHYPLLYATRFNWLILAIVLALGPLIRHFFNSRHAGKGSPWWVWPVAALAMALIGYLSAAGPRQELGQAGAASLAAVEEIVVTRCSMCHGATPGWPGIAHAPQGIRLDTPDAIRRHLRLVELAAVRSDAMPPGNVTDMTPRERATIAAWLVSERQR